jgi:PAS domain S-box-containing protein
MRSWEEVHRLHDLENRSARDIARTLGMSRNTVRRLLTLPEAPRHGRLRSGSRLDPYRETILSLLEANPKMPATVVRRRLAGLGYEGGVTILKEYLATVRPQSADTSRRSHSATVPTRIGGDWGPLPANDVRIDHPHLLQEPDAELGMNLISTDFEIIVVNRANERLFKKPMVEMLGKKCYWEFERRHEVCPHCPGAPTLATGHPHRVETTGIRDDGTKYRVRISTYPILDPLGAPVGFVETEEDITERGRSEKLLELLEDLEASLAATRDLNTAVRQALNVAFPLEGVDFGCAYVREGSTAEYRTIAQRGVSRDLAEALSQRRSPDQKAHGLQDQGGTAADGPFHPAERPMAFTIVPIMQDGLTVARLILGSFTYPEFPPATNAALEALGRMVGGAIASFRAEQLRKETKTGVEALLAALPLAIWCVDVDDRVTLWNRAAERDFGWRASEVLGSHPPFSLERHPVTGDAREQEFRCRSKDGAPLIVRATVVPLPRLMGATAATLTVAEVVALIQVDGSRRAEGAATAAVAEFPQRKPHLLLVEHDLVQRRVLRRILRDMGCTTIACGSIEEALGRYRAGVSAGRRIDLVISELLPPAGPGGLDLANRLIKLDPHAKVVVSADSPIVGFESYGLAGALQKPYARTAVAKTISALLGLSKDVR